VNVRRFSGELFFALVFGVLMAAKAETLEVTRAETAYHPVDVLDPERLLSPSHFADIASGRYVVVEGYIDYVAKAWPEKDGDYHFEMQSTKKLHTKNPKDGLVCEIDPVLQLHGSEALRQIDQHKQITYRKVHVYGFLRFGTEANHAGVQKYELPTGKNVRGRFVQTTSEKIEHIVRFSEEYPKQLRYSFIIQLFVALESRGKALCNEVNNRNKELLLTVNDLQRGGNLRGIRTFLSKVYPIPDVTGDQWKHLDDLRVIRNCLVHKNGQIDPTDKDAARLQQIIAKKEGIGVGYDGYLSIERSYCDKALRLVIEFFEIVFEKAGFGPSFFGRWPENVETHEHRAISKSREPSLEAKSRHVEKA
jgi:hypothetical protein